MPQQLVAPPRIGTVSRRSLLLSLASGISTRGTFAGALSADEGTDPSDPSATWTSGRASRTIGPVRQKTIELQPISADYGRTVVRSIAADPRGQLIAVAGDDHAIRLLNVQTLQTVATLQGHSDLIRTLAFDAQGRRLVSAGNDGQLIVWDRQTDFQVLQRMAAGMALTCVRFSPDGREMAAVGFESDLYLIGRADGDSPRLNCACNDLRAVAYRGDGAMLVVAGRSGDLHLFDRGSNRLVGGFPVHRGRAHALTFAPSSPVVVSVGEDGVVGLFDTEAKQVVAKVPVTSGKLFSLSIVDSEHLAVAGSDNVIRIVDVTVGRVVEQLSGHVGSIAALASHGGQLFSGGYDATLRRWILEGIQNDRERIAERDRPIDR
ncbi:WD40 repeat domain-containing protein [Roseiconus nitratireducens]|nr:WD40 repeat domain-containing protein [Roseiconus nitratireducens]